MQTGRARDALEESIYRAAEYGADRPRTFDVPEDAHVQFGPPGDPFDGMTLSWVVAETA
ncbi:hypothetical protein [Mycobacterium kyogaense]|uniref:hypothetical protein n=1 Tax=Mycobacterium kyogaense TaxID=2212479 RepID=UPI0013C45F07|nr:hypothetical protein [Mycobacterium kyogaense]